MDWIHEVSVPLLVVVVIELALLIIQLFVCGGILSIGAIFGLTRFRWKHGRYIGPWVHIVPYALL